MISGYVDIVLDIWNSEWTHLHTMFSQIELAIGVFAGWNMTNCCRQFNCLEIQQIDQIEYTIFALAFNDIFSFVDEFIMNITQNKAAKHRQKSVLVD